ncbi:MAG: histidine kinase N-terminal 7TM domain-containing protein [Lachnospiraceae bacterium]|nr:histidine kinase N-terminal 7TM domain-containing protein [Lachnospiraceae bacterium]
MREVTNVLKRLSIYYILMAAMGLVEVSVWQDRFMPVRLSNFLLPPITVCLILYYSFRVERKGILHKLIMAIGYMQLLFMILRTLKYELVADLEISARHTWYSYYIPTMLIPMLLFFIALTVARREPTVQSGTSMLFLFVTLFLLFMVLTNDSHQLIFRFGKNFEDWNSDYSYGWLYWVVIIWQYFMYLCSMVILIFKSRIDGILKNTWVILIPFFIGVFQIVLLMTGHMLKINDLKVLEFPEIYMFMTAGILECFMELRLIPVNDDYNGLFRLCSLACEIRNNAGKILFSTECSRSLSEQQLVMPSGSRVEPHSIMQKRTIPGGFGYIVHDISRLDQLEEALSELRGELLQETELLRHQNELKEKQAVIEHRIAVYDSIVNRVKRQSLKISELAGKAKKTSDRQLQDRYRREILLLSAYIKRYANMMLIAETANVINTGELCLSVNEYLRYLNFYGIPGECVHTAEGSIAFEAALGLFEAFESIVEKNLPGLRGVIVNISRAERRIQFKINLEMEPGEEQPACGGAEEVQTLQYAAGGTGSRQLVSMDTLYMLANLRILTREEQEDEITYICFTYQERGDSV